MTKHTLFVCTSCSASIAHHGVTEDTIADVKLLKMLGGAIFQPD